MLAGRAYEFGSIEETLAISAVQRKAEIEYLKVQAIVNAIISVGNHVSAAVSGSESSKSDALNKSLESLKYKLLPQYAEGKEARARDVKKILMEEAARGPLKIRVVDGETGKKKKRRR